MNVDAALARDYAMLATELRAAGLNVEVYGNDAKLGKQFKYADDSGVPLSVMIGAQEHAAGTAKIKDLRVAFKEKGDNEIDRGARRARRALGRDAQRDRPSNCVTSRSNTLMPSRQRALIATIGVPSGF